MKTYFVLLCVLYVSVAANAVMSFLLGAPAALTGKAVLDLAAMGFCLYGTYGLAFGKRYFAAFVWRIAYQAVLLLGALTVIMYINGEATGAAPAQGLGLLHMTMMFLPFLLFAVPPILYANKLKESAKA